MCVGAAAVCCSTPGSVAVNHLANVEALVQRAAAEAATRSGGTQLEQSIDRLSSTMERQASVPRGAPPSYAASTAVVCLRLLTLCLPLLPYEYSYKASCARMG